MAHEYLLKEYELCFEQLRFYDQRQESLLKYAITLTSAIATAQFAIYRLLHDSVVEFFQCSAILSSLVFIGILLLFLAMLQNRLYFIYVARQLNAIRGYLMEAEAGNFKNNQMYISTDFPALKACSIHTFVLVGTALISSMFAGACAYAICRTYSETPSFVLVAVVCTVVLSAEVAGGMAYLSRFGRKTADHAVHNKRPVEPT